MSIDSEIMDRFQPSRCLNDHIDHFYMIGPFWDYFWDHFGTILRLFLDHFGTIMGQLLDHFGTILGLFWDHFGTILGKFWDNYWTIIGTILGLFWDPSYFYLWGPILTYEDLFRH